MAALHTQQAVRERHAELFAKFCTKRGDIEIHVCPVCRRLNTQHEMVPCRVDHFRKVLQLHPMVAGMESWQTRQVCRQCMVEIRLGKLPPYATANYLDADDPPEELQGSSALARLRSNSSFLL